MGAKYVYKISDEEGNVVFRGTCKEIETEFGLPASSHCLVHYVKKRTKLKRKYYVDYDCKLIKQYSITKKPKPRPKAKGPYQELLEKQIMLLQDYPSVVGFHKNIEKNIRDLLEAGFETVKREVVYRDGKGRPVKYWILEKA